jgi:two-component system, NtrC family, response regulator AtoC
MTQRTQTLDAATGDGSGEEQAFLVVRVGAETRIVPLADGEEVTIGRARGCTLYVDDEHVSRLHAVVGRRGDEVVVTDKGSRNGTFLRGVRVEGAVRARPGDLVTVGPLVAIVARNARPTDLVAAEVVIADPPMAQVHELCRRVAATPLSVLITGETGVGKERVAEAIHRLGPRADRPYVRLHIASLPESLLESELFGHEKGAFTGAGRRRVGYFESAAGGTLFLDEIGELPLPTQAKLLRTLEMRTVVRLGSTEEVGVDVRIVAATNRDLAGDVRAGRFREDLYFRLSAFRIEVPPLRERSGEIPLLAALFVRDIARRLEAPVPLLTEEALAALAAYSWPGNVRELKHAVEAAFVLAAPGDIQARHLPEPIRRGGASGPPAAAADLPAAVDEVERRSIIAALTACQGNQTHAAVRLGISRRSLIYKMAKHQIQVPRGKP